MGTVCKKTATKPLPAGAEIILGKGERLDKPDVQTDCPGLELARQKAK
jgi:hypothetical protein